MADISVLIAVFNEEEFIEKSLNSILSQRLNELDVEIIVCDDQSTDNTVQIVKALQKKHQNISLVYNHNKGKVAAFNLAYKHSKGRYICFFAGDDFMPPNSIRERWELVQTRDIASGRILEIDEFDNEYGTYPKGIEKVSLSGIAPLFSRNIAELIFPIPTELPNEDLWMELVIRFFFGNQIARTDNVVAHWRRHSGNSFARSINFKTFNSAYTKRMRAYEVFHHFYKTDLTNTDRLLLEEFIKLEHARKNGKVLAQIFTRLPFKIKVASCLKSNTLGFYLLNIIKRYFL